MPEIPKGYKQTEVGVIPEDWDVSRLASIVAEISMGPFGSDITVDNFVSTGIPVLSGQNVRAERLNDDFVKFVTPVKARSLKKAVARRGDIIVTHRGTLGQISYIPADSVYDAYVISQSQFRVRLDQEIIRPAWVVRYFHSPYGANSLLEGKGHTGVPALAQPTTMFRGLFVPIPSIKEQDTIITVLRDADALIESLELLIAKKRQIKQGTMQELLTGKRRLPGFSGAWEMKRLGDIIENAIGGGTPSRNTPAYWGDDIPWATVKDFATFDPWLTQESITKEGLVKSASHLISAGTLITATRMALGKAMIYEVDVAINQDLKALVLKSGIAVRFLSYWFEHFGHLLNSIGGGSTVKGISLTQLRGISLQLPPLKDEQSAIAEVLSDMDAEIEALDSRLAKARLVKQGMMQELLTGRIRLI